MVKLYGCDEHQFHAKLRVIAGAVSELLFEKHEKWSQQRNRNIGTLHISTIPTQRVYQLFDKVASFKHV